ncbi:RNA methyltransferase [Desulfuromonas versatilis]|uniref:RNA methyltransferase n=1 Tax=Desulfuromonas versatilis TaxID=2802975 RepID=A0ABM8HTF2_9BACT|nr:class I SAM-dependent RNA methyltransferase [Desulfuromonas versatilis]BCR03911.1 RNA methyltransferase [Desulfuromonas versatilis]
MKKPDDRLFAVTAPGLEGVCAAELAALGMAEVEAVAGGVEFCGGLREIYLGNLWLRTASRVLVRMGEVRSRDFPDLYKKTVKLPWGRFIRPDTRLRVRAVSHGSRLGHTGRISATVAEAVNRALGRKEQPETGPEQLILARFEDDLCQFSVDSSGELLHRRGYREEAGAAPLRETLAAGMLLLLGWQGQVPLADPMCGSGSLVIEAALLARNLPPGRARRFAFMDWPRYRPGLWDALRLEAGRSERPCPVPLAGSDQDPLVLELARRNALRAGVAEVTAWDCRPLQQLQSDAGCGLLISNPPYGERIGRGPGLVELFRSLGQVLVERRPGWSLAFLCPDPELARQTDLAPACRAELHNGGIAVGLYTATRGQNPR